MALTSTQQANGVSEGMALGLLALGRDTLPADKLAIDLAFLGAWRSWPQRSAFPSVRPQDGMWAITRADRRKHVSALYWERDGAHLKISAAQPDWNPNDSKDLDFAARVISGGLPHTAWADLAREFLKRFDAAAVDPPHADDEA